MILEFRGIEWETINNSFSERYYDHLQKYLFESEEYFEGRKETKKIREEIVEVCKNLGIEFTTLNDVHEMTVGHRHDDIGYEKLNDLIHYYEREQQNYPPRWGFRNGNSPMELVESDYDYFTVDRKYGYLYTMYPHVARHFAEAVMADDPSGTIRPQELVRPNFFCWLGSDMIVEDKFMVMAKQFIDKYKLSYDLNDKKLAIGYIPFARLKSEVKDLIEILQGSYNEFN